MSAKGLPCLDCLARLEGRKETPSGLNWHLLMVRDARSADRDGLVRAINMTSL